MNKDLLLAGSVSLLLHGTVALFSLLQTRAPALIPVSQDKNLLFVVPAPPPDPLEDDDLLDKTDKQAASNEAAPAAPSLADLPTMAPSPFIVGQRPPLPPAPIDGIRIPPEIGPGGNGPGIGPVFDPGQLSRQPIATIQAPPNYPFERKREGISGTVIVEFIVDARGNVRQPFAVKSDYPDFAAAAVSAVSKWRFRPGMKGGQAVATRMQVPIVFSLNSAE